MVVKARGIADSAKGERRDKHATETAGEGRLNYRLDDERFSIGESPIPPLRRLLVYNRDRERERGSSSH